MKHWHRVGKDYMVYTLYDKNGDVIRKKVWRGGKKVRDIKKYSFLYRFWMWLITTLFGEKKND